MGDRDKERGAFFYLRGHRRQEKLLHKILSCKTVAQGFAVQPAGKRKAWPEWILSIVAVGHQEKIVWLNQNQLASVKTTLIMSAV